MTQIAFFLPLIILIAYPSGSLQQNPSVVNKVDFKFYVDLVASTIGNEWRCSGALIKPTWILTAAGCLDRAERVSISIGNDLNATVNGSSWVIHHGYSPVTQWNNLALIKTPKPVAVGPIEIFVPGPDIQELNSTFVRVGHRRETPQAVVPSNLESARVKSVEISECEQFFKRDMPGEKALCYRAVNRDDYPLCVGEVGAPLIVMSGQFEKGLVGIYSFPPSEKCSMDLPAVYTNAYVYKKWIDMAMRSYDKTRGPPAVDPNRGSGSTTVKPQNVHTVHTSTRGYDHTTATAKPQNEHTVHTSTRGYDHTTATVRPQNEHTVHTSTRGYDHTTATVKPQNEHTVHTSTRGYDHTTATDKPQNEHTVHTSTRGYDHTTATVKPQHEHTVHTSTRGNDDTTSTVKPQSDGTTSESSHITTSPQWHQTSTPGHQKDKNGTIILPCQNGTITLPCQNGTIMLPGGISIYPSSSVVGNTNLKINITINIENE